MVTGNPGKHQRGNDAESDGVQYEKREGVMSTAVLPNVRYYARLDYCTESGKVPKYAISQQIGYYPPMNELKGKDGRVSMYLQVSRDSGSNKDTAPAMKLQAKGSLNFTGLKDYFINGRISGFAYGCPPETRTYSSKQTPNPFYEYRQDGFLFIVHQNAEAPTPAEQICPDYIELVVLAGAKVLIASYCKMLQEGGFNEALEQLRKEAKPAE